MSEKGQGLSPWDQAENRAEYLEDDDRCEGGVCHMTNNAPIMCRRHEEEYRDDHS